MHSFVYGLLYCTIYKWVFAVHNCIWVFKCTFCMGFFSAQCVWAVVVTLCMRRCSAQFLWDFAVQSFYGLFYCTVCMGR